MSTPTASYDVVVVGTELPALLAGALLAKRGFRVLLLGQDDLSPDYRATEDRTLPRAPFNFVSAASPAARRVLAELAVHQSFRRRASQIDPAMQICLPRHRFDFATDPTYLEREIEREFPEVKRVLEELLATVERHDALLDRLLERDLVWPPQSFLERRELARAIASLPFDKDGEGADPLSELAEDHPFRLAVELPTRFSADMDPDHTTSLRTTRLFAAWRRGGAVLEGGYGQLRELLTESVRINGGEVRDRERVDAILTRRGAATGVTLAASGDEIGADTVIFGGPLSSMLRLVPDRGPFEELFERIGEPVIRYYRYTLNLVVRAEGVPAGMSRDVFFVRDPDRPLSAANAIRIQNDRLDERESLLTVEALLPRRAVEEVADYMDTLRERLAATVGELIPFLGDHLLLMDSPHDGREVQLVSEGRRLAPLDAWSRGPQTMAPIWGFPLSTALGVAALPVRSPVKRLLLANTQIVPGLGLEGAFLAGWSAARAVARSDRRGAWVRRGRFRKLEA